MTRITRKIATFIVLMLVALCAFAGAASASPGAYNVLIAHSNAEPPTTFRNALAAFPDVARVDLFDTSAGTPTAAQLEAYDLVVSQSGDPAYQDQTAYGNALADFYDHGGVVIQYAWDNDINSDYAPLGRWVSGGYQPFLPGDVLNTSSTLGAHNAASPLMEGVGALQSEFRTLPTLAPGATLLATWADGENLVAVKGRAVSVSAYVGDDYGPPATWSGDFARLAVNAARVGLPVQCVVPKLKGKKLKRAKKVLRSGECKLGKVKKRKGLKKGKVRKQNPPPGTVLPVDSKVNVKLG